MRAVCAHGAHACNSCQPGGCAHIRARGFGWCAQNASHFVTPRIAPDARRGDQHEGGVMPAAHVADLAILAVLERACAEAAADPRATPGARCPALTTAHIAHALTLPEDAAVLAIPADVELARLATGPLVHALVRLKHDRYVHHERRTVRGVLGDWWALSLEGLARVRREQAA